MNTYGITTKDFELSPEDYATIGFYKIVNVNGVNYQCCYDFTTSMSDYDDLHISTITTEGSDDESDLDEDDLLELFDTVLITAKAYLKENYDACLERHQQTENTYGE